MIEDVKDLVCPYCGNHSFVARCQPVDDEDYPTGEYFYLACLKCNTTHMGFDELVTIDAYNDAGKA